MPFELPPWLQEPAHPFEKFAQGAAIGVQIGKAFADNMYRNQAMYVRARQEQQEQDLRVRELSQRDSSFALQSTIARTKMTHDAEDYEKLTTFVPTVSSAHTFDELNTINLPPLHDTQNYLKMSAMLDRTKTEKAMGEMGAELATTTDWADPSVYGIMLKWAKKAPDITLAPAYDHLLGRHQAAVVAARTAARLQEETDSRIAGREERADYNAKSLALRQLLADHSIPLTDARVVQAQQAEAIALRRLQVQEGNLALRDREQSGKENRLGLRERYLNERNAIDREEKAKLATMSATGPEADATRKVYNLKRREVTKKFYGPGAPKPDDVPAPATTAHDPRVPRAGLQTEDRSTNAPPTAVAPTASFDTEVKMANEAIAENPARKAEIAEQFKKRTGRDLP